MSNPYTVGVDTSTLPNEPLSIVITEAGSECIMLRGLLEIAVNSLINDYGTFQQVRIANMIIAVLQD